MNDEQTSDKSLLSRIAELEDRDALRELTARYAFHTARADIPAMIDAFTDDGRFGSVGSLRAKHELADFFGQNIRPQERIPLVFNHIFHVNGHHGVGSCMMYSPWSPEGAFCGHYQDTYRKSEVGWKFVERLWTYYRDPNDLK